MDKQEQKYNCRPLKNESQRGWRYMQQMTIDLGEAEEPGIIVFETKFSKRVDSRAEEETFPDSRSKIIIEEGKNFKKKRFPIFKNQEIVSERGKAWHVRTLKEECFLKSKIYSSKNQRQKIFKCENSYQTDQKLYQKVDRYQSLIQDKSVANHMGDIGEECQDESDREESFEISHSTPFEKTFIANEKYQVGQCFLQIDTDSEPILIPQQTSKRSHHKYLTTISLDHQMKAEGVNESTCFDGSIERVINPQKNNELNKGHKKKPSQCFDHRERRRYMPPWIQDLSQRLYDGRFKNSRYYADKCKFSQKLKKQQFQKMIDSSHLASRMLTRTEIDSLFEEVKTSEPVERWRSKIVDFQCSKMRKLYEYDQLSRSINSK